MKSCWVLPFLVGISGLCSAQQNGAASASVSGVVTGTTGELIAGATVALDVPTMGAVIGAGKPPPPVYTALTNAQGRFEFPDVKPDRYVLSARMAGFLGPSYFTASSIVNLTSGQRLTDLAAKLVREAIVKGRILNQDGDPVPDVPVVAARRLFVEGRRQIQMERRATTGTDGVFSIGDLPAGVYYVNAASGHSATRPSDTEAYAATYYPSAAEPAGATAIPLAAGATVQLADMRLRKVGIYHIRGKVVDASTGAAPHPNTQINVAPQDRDQSPSWGLGGRVPKGTFDFPGFPPGVYLVHSTPVPIGRLPDGTMAFTLAGRQTVTITNADADLVLQLKPASEITGRVSPASGGRMSITLTSLDYPLSVPQILQTDGLFKIQNIEPAVYRVDVYGVAPRMYVKSIRFGDQNITKAPLDLTSGISGQIEVLLSPNAAEITGAVHGANLAALVGITVTMWTPGVPPNADFSQTATTGADGQFKFTSIPPGEYRVAAWEQIDRGLGLVPEFRTKFESRAATVKLNENDHARIEPALIPRDAIEAEASKLR